MSNCSKVFGNSTTLSNQGSDKKNWHRDHSEGETYVKLENLSLIIIFNLLYHIYYIRSIDYIY